MHKCDYTDVSSPTIGETSQPCTLLPSAAGKVTSTAAESPFASSVSAHMCMPRYARDEEQQMIFEGISVQRPREKYTTRIYVEATEKEEDQRSCK